MKKNSLKIIVKGISPENMLKKSLNKKATVRDYCFCKDCRCEQAYLNVINSKKLVVSE